MSFNPPAEARRRVSWVIVVVVAVVAAAVGVGATAAYFEVYPPSSTPSGSSNVALTDDLGRQVSVSPNPARVVVLAPSIMDSMVRLGLRSHVVGVDCDNAFGGLSADYNASQITQWTLTSAMCVDIAPSLNAEDLLNKTPELMLASTLSPVGNLEEASITYHVPLVILAPSSVGGILVDVTLLGQLFSVTSTAAKLVALLEGALGLAQNVSTTLTNAGTVLPGVLLTYYASPEGSQSPGYFTYGPGTFGQSLIELASGASISAGAAIPYPELSGSQVLADNPQVIVYGTGFGLTLSTYQAGPSWGSLPAVMNGQAFAIDSNYITEADPSMILVGLPFLLHLLHPTLVPG